MLTPAHGVSPSPHTTSHTTTPKLAQAAKSELNKRSKGKGGQDMGEIKASSTSVLRTRSYSARRVR